MSNEGALALMDDDAEIAQLASGKFLKHIAARYGVDKTAIYKRLKRHPGYADAIIQQAEALVEQATDEVFNCSAETVNIARARVDAAHKWAAARDPKRWGPKQEITHNLPSGPLIMVNLAEVPVVGTANSPQVIDNATVIDTADTQLPHKLPQP